MDKKGLGIVLHTASFDRLYHGLSIGLAASALGRDVRLFFSYWALGYLKKENKYAFELDKEALKHKGLLEKNIKEGHMVKVQELFSQAKRMGAKFYACTSSMGLLNIARDELIDEVDKSMGITTFLTEISDYQIIFI